jgi:hypothetical protein
MVTMFKLHRQQAGREEQHGHLELIVQAIAQLRDLLRKHRPAIFLEGHLLGERRRKPREWQSEQQQECQKDLRQHCDDQPVLRLGH